MNDTLEIIAQGHRWVAVNKPAGIGVERHFNYDTVEKRALEQFKRPKATKPPYIGIVHRLDRPVSGALLLAQNKTTLVALNQAFAERKVDKTYWALVENPPLEIQGRLKHYLLRDKLGRKAIAAKRPLPKAKEAILTYKLIDSFPQGHLLEIKPITGKFHQIRVQLATAGMPILGDHLYGASQVFGTNSIALHARALNFKAPSQGAPLTVQAPLPDTWQISLD